ncbi:hypothetical protein ABIA38_007199 [Embleya sp. AB8]
MSLLDDATTTRTPNAPPPGPGCPERHAVALSALRRYVARPACTSPDS